MIIPLHVVLIFPPCPIHHSWSCKRLLHCFQLSFDLNSCFSGIRSHLLLLPQRLLQPLISFSYFLICYKVYNSCTSLLKIIKACFTGLYEKSFNYVFTSRRRRRHRRHRRHQIRRIHHRQSRHRRRHQSHHLQIHQGK
jgi:hypothetical protein